MKWIRFFVRKSEVERELDSEIRFHLESVIQEKIAAGVAPEKARRDAILEFGGREQIKEECRYVHRLVTVENTLANLKSALRFIRKSPAFSFTVILTLALGIGANSAVFSAIDAILLRPLPLPNAGELVILHQYNRTLKNPETFLAPVRLKEWDRMNSTFQAITGYYTENVSESSGTLPERLMSIEVAPGFLEVLGVAPRLGRDFTPSEEHFGGPNATLISDRFWRRRFHADPAAIGKTLRVEGWAFQIVGVMPANFHFPDENADLWRAVPMDAPYAQDRNSTWFTAIGRLRAGVTVSQARADLDTVQARLASQFPKPDKDIGSEVQPLKEVMVSGSRRSLWILFGSVSLLLLIACTNIASLLLSRTTGRQREISIRYSLGASRASVITQLLTESAVLALLGSAAGLVIAAGAVRIFHSLAKALPRAAEIALDWRLVLYTLACAVIATLLFGLVPALIASRQSISPALAASSRSQVSERVPLQWTLVGIQVALAVTLLVGAGLLLRSFQELGRVSPGFDATHVLTLRISGNYGETGNLKTLHQRIMRTLEALRAVPGVAAVAISTSLPGTSNQFPAQLRITDAATDPSRVVTASGEAISGRYFETVGIPLLAGGTCKDNGRWDSVVVNQSFANEYLSGQPVIGHHLEVTPNPYHAPPAEIIGIAANAREYSLSQAPRPTVYVCSTNGMPDPYFLVRTYGDPLSIANSLRQTIHRLEPARSVFDVMPLEQHLTDSTAENRFRTILLTLFAATAISLAALGLYGTLSYLVALGNREIGLRMALGAVPSQIAARYLSQGLRVSLFGCLIGLGVAAALSRLLAGMLYGVSRVDVVTYFAVAIGAIAIAALASAFPARRAARLDPMQTLRHD